MNFPLPFLLLPEVEPPVDVQRVGSGTLAFLHPSVVYTLDSRVV